MEVKLPFRTNGRKIPVRYTEYGENISPAVEFVDVPEDAESLVFTVENIDALESKSVHWVIWNIPPGENLPENVSRTERPPEVEGAVQGNNDFKVLGYSGPRYPPMNHVFRFTVYALDTELNLAPGDRLESVKEAFRGSVLDRAVAEAVYTD